MLPLVGMLVVFCSVIGGFALENGRFAPLAQPSEAVIICGAAIGTLLISNPVELLKKTYRCLLRIFRGPPLTKAGYLGGLLMLHALFDYARRNGATKLEDQLDHPERSIVFRRHAAASREIGVLSFICDTLRLTTMTKMGPRDLDELLDKEMEAREKELGAPAETVAALADALPGLGIISAVLGVIITMGSITATPRVIGEKVGSALVGTFLGIFISYGFVAPLGEHLSRLCEAEVQYFQMLRAALGAFGKGFPSSIALEFGRRAIPPDLRPGFGEMEMAFREAREQSAHKVITMP